MIFSSKYIYLLPAFLFFGCKKFVQVELPLDKVNSKSVFANDESAKTTIAGLYGSMIDASYMFSFRIGYMAGLYTDELDYKLTDPRTLELYQNKLIPQNSQTNTLWTFFYKCIYQSNSILEGLANTTKVSAGLKDQLRGEALFFRAFWYYYLVNTYGKVPLVMSTDFRVNAVLPATSVDSIYMQIEADLVAAKSLLSDKYVDNSSVKESAERIRVNKMVAKAFLARIYLYRGSWEKAESEASLLLNDPAYGLEDVSKVFKRISKEVIFQFANTGINTNNLYNSYEAHYFTITATPTSSSVFRSYTISEDLLNKFEAGDLRKINWVGIYKDVSVSPNKEYPYPAKYKSISTTLDEYSTAFRLAEQYLIRAEARAQLNKLADAIKDLDKIRERAGIDKIEDTDPLIEKQDLLSLIMEERERELFCEYGHRFFDLKRTGKLDDAMTAAAIRKGSVWSPDFKWWPIPQSEVFANVFLDQNEGYY